jgi:peptidoglycan-associated lipoprotein
MKQLVAAVTLTLALTACASTKKVVEQEPRDPDAAYFIARELAIDAMQKNFARVHFTFDSTSITEESRDALAANVTIMQKFRDLGVEVAGHCDETGSTEYNLALGQRRADAIRKYMVTAGVAGYRVLTISYGEERPFDDADDLEAYAENRRAEFRITVDPTQPRLDRSEDPLAQIDPELY